MHGMNNIKFTSAHKQWDLPVQKYQRAGKVCAFCWSSVMSLLSIMRGINNTKFIANEFLLDFLNVNETESSINN